MITRHISTGGVDSNFYRNNDVGRQFLIHAVANICLLSFLFLLHCCSVPALRPSLIFNNIDPLKISKKFMTHNEEELAVSIDIVPERFHFTVEVRVASDEGMEG